MHDARALDAANPAQAALAMVEEGVDQRAGRVPGSRVYHQIGRFVDHQQVIIFVQDIQGNVLWQHLAGNGIRPVDLDLVSHPGVVGGFRRGAIHEHGPFGDQLLKAPP